MGAARALGGLIACGCYHGTARNVTLAELGAAQSWERVAGVPEVRQVAREDCGAAALAMVLGYWGFRSSATRFVAASAPGRERGIERRTSATSPDARACRRSSSKAGSTTSIARFRRRHPAVVGMMKRYAQRAYPHYEVVVGIDRAQQRVLTLDPASGLRVNSREGFSAEWAAAHQVTLVVYK